MGKLTKIVGLALATLFLVTTLALAAAMPGTVTSVQGDTVIVSAGGKDVTVTVKDAAAQYKAGDRVTLDGKKITKAK